MPLFADLVLTEGQAVAAGGAFAAAIVAAAIRYAWRKISEAGVAKEIFGWACLAAACGSFGTGAGVLSRKTMPETPPFQTSPQVLAVYEERVRAAREYPVPVEAGITLIAMAIPLAVLGGSKVHSAWYS